MIPNDELGNLRAAYGNCLNDLARAKAQLRDAEVLLRQMADLLVNHADTLALIHQDNPGRTGSGR